MSELTAQRNTRELHARDDYVCAHAYTKLSNEQEMDKTRDSDPLIQRGDQPLVFPWYKRKSVIVIIALVGVFAVCMALVVIVVPVALTHGSKCAYSNPYDCTNGPGLDDLCMWCFNSDGTGLCKLPPKDGPEPLNCSPQEAFYCIAYGFATNQNETACLSFDQCSHSSCCRWSNPHGNCYYDDGTGPIGCCFAD